MATITPKTVIIAFTTGLMLIVTSATELSSIAGESKCKLLDHEPFNTPQVVEFVGGKLTFNASLAFLYRGGEVEKFVVLESTGRAKLERPDDSWLFVYVDFDCAKVIFKIRNQQTLRAEVDYSASLAGSPCLTSSLGLTNLEFKWPYCNFWASFCPLRHDSVRPLLAIRYLKFELDT